MWWFLLGIAGLAAVCLGPWFWIMYEDERERERLGLPRRFRRKP